MVVELVVDRIVAGGTGISEYEGRKVFVPYSAPGERIRARFVVEKRDYAVARIDEIVEPSPLRVSPPCPHFGQCGGCQLQHVSAEGQLVARKLIVNDALQRLGHVYTVVRNITGATSPWHYRNKTQYPVRFARNLKIGYFRQGSHNLIDIPACLIHPPTFDGVRKSIIDAMWASGERAYDERNHTGNVRHLVLRTNASGELLVIVVTRTRNLETKLVDTLRQLPGVVGVVQSLNRERTNRILGERDRIVFGRDYLEQEVLGRKLRVSARSFFQVNTPQAEVLGRKVLKHLSPTGDERVLDLYSGVGMLSLVLADFVRGVTAVEADESAVADARHNTEAGGTANVKLVHADVDAFMGGGQEADAVVIDPPRRGCQPETLKRIAELKPRRIVYVSCDPATLARDLRFLAGDGYETCDVEPVDMFPQTAHVETIATLVPKS